MLRLLYSFICIFYTVECQTNCVGDVNSDSIVDVNDLLNVLSRFSENGDLNEDVDMNGSVDVNDILLTLSNYGETCNVGNIVCNRGNDCGGQVWNDCGTSCPLICSEPEIMMCNMMCNPEYQCPSNLWWDSEISECVEQTDCSIVLPPDIAIGRPYTIDNKNNLAKCINIVNDWNK